MTNIYASKGKGSSKGKVKAGDGKGGKSNWRAPCDEFWKPGGCSQGHHCPKYHPRRQPGRCAKSGSTRHYTSQCARPVKPKAKNVEWNESTWETEEYEESKGKKGKGKRSKSKGKSKRKGAPRSNTPRPAQSQSSTGDRSQPKAKPEARSCMTNDFLFAMMSTKSKPTWRTLQLEWHRLHDLHSFCTSKEAAKSSSLASGHCFQIAESPLYGHDAKSMKNFTLHFDMAEQCDSPRQNMVWRDGGFLWRNMSFRSNPLSHMTQFQIQQI